MLQALAIVFLSFHLASTQTSNDDIFGIFKDMEANKPLLTFSANGTLGKHMRNIRDQTGGQLRTCRQHYPVGDRYANCRVMHKELFNFMPQNQAAAQLDHVGGCVLKARILHLIFPINRNHVSEILHAALYIPTAGGPLKSRIIKVCHYNSKLKPQNDMCHIVHNPFHPISDKDNHCTPINVKQMVEAALELGATFMKLDVELECQQCGGVLSGFPYVLVEYTTSQA